MRLVRGLVATPQARVRRSMSETTVPVAPSITLSVRDSCEVT